MVAVYYYAAEVMETPMSEHQQYIVPFPSLKSMNRILVLFTLCLTALSIQCDEDGNYIKVIKESVNDCEEESFLIKNQGQVVFRSPTFAEWEREEFEH